MSTVAESTVRDELEVQLRSRIDDLIIRAENAESDLLIVQAKLDNIVGLIGTAAAMARNMGTRGRDPDSEADSIIRLVCVAADMAAWVHDDVYDKGGNLRSRSRGRESRRT